MPGTRLQSTEGLQQPRPLPGEAGTPVTPIKLGNDRPIGSSNEARPVERHRGAVTQPQSALPSCLFVMWAAVCRPAYSGIQSRTVGPRRQSLFRDVTMRLCRPGGGAGTGSQSLGVVGMAPDPEGVSVPMKALLDSLAHHLGGVSPLERRGSPDFLQSSTGHGQARLNAGQISPKTCCLLFESEAALHNALATETSVCCGIPASCCDRVLVMQRRRNAQKPQPVARVTPSPR
ncbi:hypothetical protein SKAU_G00221440 [Synaphobranchus kaupii]|uniref:Uncharacterized protein n=1 Tax=Synaphobranchus kaupii TaxID=118154 RepID=A0A9Q1FB36_SYNKA|nr:hypothetical protein SKAU_G00221440 [Synaphobranchus kaupii]